MISALGVTAVYVGSGSAGPFTLVNADADPILFENNSELVVQRYTDPDDSNPTTLTLTTHYTVTGAGLDSAGTVTLVTPLAVGQTLVITRATPRTQTLDLIYGGAVNLENLEETLDKIIRMVQETNERTDRALMFSAVQTDLVGTSAQLVPYPEAGRYIGWNDDADQLENKDALNGLLSGAGAPSGATGNNGDFYLDTVTLYLYGPKAGGTWPPGNSLIGPAGATGATGPQGAQGIPGTPGAPGAGTGDVVSSGVIAADLRIAVFDGTSGDIIKDGGTTLATLNSTIAGKYAPGGTDVALADGGTGASLADPNADRIMFWDDSAGAVTWLAPSTGLAISTTNLALSFLGLEALTDPNADRILFWDDSASAFAWGSPTLGLEINTTDIRMTANQRTVGLAFIIDGGGSTIATGVKGYVQIPFACTITACRLLADQSGSIVVDIWKDTYANYPPVNADSITASANPTITTATKSEDTTLTGWTTAISAGDILGFNVDSVTSHQRVTVMLTLLKT